MTTKSLKFHRLFGGSFLAATVAGAISLLPETATALDLKFDTPVQATETFIPGGFGNASQAYSGTVIDYRNVATGVDARVTATLTGANYSFLGHLPDYGNPGAEGDAGFLYQIATGGTGLGGLTYKIELFEGGGTFSRAYTATDLRFVVYDVDGQPSQGESFEIDKNSGLVSYQVSSSVSPLLFTENTNSYLFSGRDANVGEDDTSGGLVVTFENSLATRNSPFSIPSSSVVPADYRGATILNFENTGAVTFNFKANTRSPDNSSPNLVFSAIDGDLTSIGGSISANNWSPIVRVASSSNAATAVPEPFTIVGSIIGGTAALRMRKKLKVKQ